MTTVKDSPYSGTIYVNDAYKGGCVKSLSKELYYIPSAYKSKISVIVKASSGAQILLYDENKDEKWALKITLGVDQGQTSTIGLNTRDAAQESAYPTGEFQTPRILSGSHFKGFVVQWNHGVVKVFDDGGDLSDPLLTWKGPSDYRVGHFGVRTLGSFGTWRVQGSPEFNTTQTDDIGAPYQHYQVNSGRLEFEIRGNNDAYFILSGQANDDDVTKLIHVAVGGWSNNRSAILESLVERANYAQVATLNPYEYRRFWVEWDAYSVRFGVYGTGLPKMYYNSAKPITQLTYFGFVTGVGSKGYLRVLETDDSDSGSGAQPTLGSY